MTKLSIITVNLNDSDGLKKTIESVLGQTFHGFEYIIIDGASTDESITHIKNIANKLSYWISEPDSGIYSAMNKGIDKSKGEYCLFLNSGDLFAGNNVLHDVFKMGADEDILYGDIINESKNSKEVVKYPVEKYITFRHFIRSTLPHPSTLIKRSLFNTIGKYDEHLKITADWKFFILAVCKYNVKIKKIDLPVSIFNTDGVSSNSVSKKTVQLERDITLKKYFNRYLSDYEDFEKLERTVAVRFWTWCKRIKHLMFFSGKN